MTAAARVRKKWRPSLGLVLLLVLTTVLALPLVGLFFFRIYENQLIHETESELIGQCAVFAAVLRREIETGFPADAPLGAPAPPALAADASEPYQPIGPSLDLAGDTLLGRRPEARVAATPASALFVELGRKLTPDLIETQRVTLAGFRILDPHGVVVAGRDEVGMSLAHVEEVADALQGRQRSVMRLRVSSREPPPLYSWSRGTGLRIFIAMPVVARGRVAAVVYASRTPSNIFRNFYAERQKIAWAALTVVALALSIGFILHRAITRPMRELMRRTTAIERGEAAAFAPLEHYGTAEFAQFAQSFLDMAASLRTRSDFIATFAAHVSHELKSPLTAIQGAAELLRDDLDAAPETMRVAERRRFLDNIVADAQRLTAIVQRLRDLARAETSPVVGAATLGAILPDLRAAFSGLTIEGAGDLDLAVAMSAENLRIVLTNLADNSERHGASRLLFDARREDAVLRIRASDDGAGVSPNHRERIFERFFTTRRESGGTGMGLAIVRAMISAHGGGIALADESETAGRGATFLLWLPLAGPGAAP